MRTVRLVVGIILLAAGVWVTSPEWNRITDHRLAERAGLLRYGMTVEEVEMTMGAPPGKRAEKPTPVQHTPGSVPRSTHPMHHYGSQSWEDGYAYVCVYFDDTPGHAGYVTMDVWPKAPPIDQWERRVAAGLMVVLGCWFIYAAVRPRPVTGDEMLRQILRPD